MHSHMTVSHTRVFSLCWGGTYRGSGVFVVSEEQVFSLSTGVGLDDQVTKEKTFSLSAGVGLSGQVSKEEECSLSSTVGLDGSRSFRG